MHSSDTVVKPITGNREIEKIADTIFAKENLPFSLYKPEDVVKHIDSSQIENHLLDIYNYLSIKRVIGIGFGFYLNFSRQWNWG